MQEDCRKLCNTQYSSELLQKPQKARWAQGGKTKGLCNTRFAQTGQIAMKVTGAQGQVW